LKKENHAIKKNLGMNQHGTSMVLESWIGFFFTALIIGGFVTRIRFEEKTLKEELKSYQEYTKEVPYRIVPGIW